MVGKRKCRVKDRKNEERESVGLRIKSQDNINAGLRIEKGKKKKV